MAKQLDDQLVDRRIVDRNIQKGLLSAAEHQKYLSALKDVADNSEVVSLGFAEDGVSEGEGKPKDSES